MVMMILVTLTMVFGNIVGLVLITVLEGLLRGCLGLFDMVVYLICHVDFEETCVM